MFKSFRSTLSTLLILSVTISSILTGTVLIFQSNKDIEVHHVRALQRVKHGYLVESIKSKDKSLRGSSKIESALNRKQIPLCREHHAQWSKLDKSQIDEFYLRNKVEPLISASKEAGLSPS